MLKRNLFRIRRNLVGLGASARCVLVGDFACDLTPEEQNRWHEFVLPHETCVAFRAKQLQADICEARVKGGAIDESNQLRQLTEEADALFDQLYQVGKDWYAALLVEREIAAKAEDEAWASQAPTEAG